MSNFNRFSESVLCVFHNVLVVFSVNFVFLRQRVLCALPDFLVALCVSFCEFFLIAQFFSVSFWQHTE